MSMTREEETKLAKDLAEEFGLDLPYAAQVGLVYDVDAAREKAAGLRALAAQRDREAAESFERCDTDGALSQWSQGLTAEKYRQEADIAENGGTAAFPALFDLAGNLLPARQAYGEWGSFWSFVDEAGNPTGRTENESSAHCDSVYRRNNARKGFYVGTVLAPAQAVTRGSKSITSVSVTTVRADGGWDPDVLVVDNGINLT